MTIAINDGVSVAEVFDRGPDDMALRVARMGMEK